MKRKGFTLIELLAVIIILGIIIGIVTVNVAGISKKQKKKNELNEISSILTAAKMYCAKNPGSDKCNPGGSNNIAVSDLDIDEEIISKYNNEISVNSCSSSNLKYSIDIDGTTYNDCGCEDQSEGKGKKLCKKDNEGNYIDAFGE